MLNYTQIILYSVNPDAQTHQRLNETGHDWLRLDLHLISDSVRPRSFSLLGDVRDTVIKWCNHVGAKYMTALERLLLSECVCPRDQLHCQRGDHCSGGSHTKTKTLFTCVCFVCVCTDVLTGAIFPAGLMRSCSSAESAGLPVSMAAPSQKH